MKPKLSASDSSGDKLAAPALIHGMKKDVSLNGSLVLLTMVCGPINCRIEPTRNDWPHEARTVHSSVGRHSSDTFGSVVLVSISSNDSRRTAICASRSRRMGTFSSPKKALVVTVPETLEPPKRKAALNWRKLMS